MGEEGGGRREEAGGRREEGGGRQTHRKQTALVRIKLNA